MEDKKIWKVESMEYNHDDSETDESKTNEDDTDEDKTDENTK